MRRIDTGQGGNRIITRTFATYEPDMAASKASLAHATRLQMRKFWHAFLNWPVSGRNGAGQAISAFRAMTSRSCGS